MAHAYYHALSSARRFGGHLEDYLALHAFMDHTKAHVPDNRHRLLLHNAWGIFFAEQVWGPILIRASDQRAVPLRTLLEQHVKEDFGGRIPRLDQCFALPIPHPLRGLDDTWTHCQRSAALFGGHPDDYLAVHAQMNQVRQILPDQVGRCILHNAWGIQLLVRLLGETITRSSDHQRCSTRQILEAHVIDDLQHIPTLGESIKHVSLARWMSQYAVPLSRSLSTHEIQEENDV